MSTTVMSQVWPLQMPPVAKAVLISLADNANDNGYCYPSISKICERTCFKKRAVIDAIKWLEANALLRANRDNGRHTTYTIPVRNLCVKRTSASGAPVCDVHLTSASGAPNWCITRTLTVNNRHKPSGDISTGAADDLELTGGESPTSGFEKFWSAFPVKKGKDTARRSWDKQGLDKIAPRIIAHVAMMLSRDATWQDKKFIPHPTTYLNQHRWLDEPVQGSTRNENRNGAPKLSAAERAEQKGRELLARINQSEGTDLLLGSNGGDVW